MNCRGDQGERHVQEEGSAQKAQADTGGAARDAEVSQGSWVAAEGCDLMLIRPRNWSDFQHYKDRSPPWIRLHRSLLDDFDFQRLHVASRALAPMLWLLAAESKDTKTGEIDASPDRLAFRLRMSEQEVRDALKPLIDNGFFFVVQDASSVLAEHKQVAVPETETETETETDITPNGVVNSVDQKQARLAEVTEQAIQAFNETLSVRAQGGLLSAVTITSDKRKAQVKRTLKLASQACERLYGSKTVTPEFWRQYFEEVQRDPFKSGRGPYGKGHENWRPDFEYLTRPDVVESVIDDAMSRGAQ